MVCPSCTHRETSASFATSAVKAQAKLTQVQAEWTAANRIMTDSRATMLLCRMAKIVVAQGVDTIRTITRECARLPDREKGLILGIVRQFRGARSPPPALPTPRVPYRPCPPSRRGARTPPSERSLRGRSTPRPRA